MLKKVLNSPFFILAAIYLGGWELGDFIRGESNAGWFLFSNAVAALGCFEVWKKYRAD